MGKISNYLNELKGRTGYTQQQLSDISGVSLGTIPRYFADMDDESANFEIVRKLVVAMNGSLDELAGITPKQLDISEEKLTADGYTETEIRAIMRWAGSEISRTYKGIVAGLEARLVEKDERLTHRDSLIADEHKRAEQQVQHAQMQTKLAVAISYVSLGLFVLLFLIDFLLPTAGWIRR